MSNTLLKMKDISKVLYEEMQMFNNAPSIYFFFNYRDSFIQTNRS